MWEIQTDRLKDLMARGEVNQSRLAELVGISQPSVGRILTGETKTSRHIYRIAEVLGTTAQYLMGKTDHSDRVEFIGTWSEMQELLSQHSDNANQAGITGQSPFEDIRMPFRHAEPGLNADLVELDFVEIGFGMGGGFIEESGEVAKRSFSRAWLREFTDAPPELLAWAKGDGDSMEPTIRDGEVVLIDRRFNQPGPDDKIWAFTVGDFGMIKRLRARADGVVEILSDNPAVPTATAVDGELHVIGRVRAIIRRV